MRIKLRSCRCHELNLRHPAESSILCLSLRWLLERGSTKLWTSCCFWALHNSAPLKQLDLSTPPAGRLLYDSSPTPNIPKIYLNTTQSERGLQLTYFQPSWTLYYHSTHGENCSEFGLTITSLCKNAWIMMVPIRIPRWTVVRGSNVHRHPSTSRSQPFRTLVAVVGFGCDSAGRSIRLYCRDTD